MLNTLLIVAGSLLVFVGWLFLMQRKMIYLPSDYPLGMERSLGGLVTLRTQTPAGEQVSFYMPPRSGEPPETVWLAFTGNGGLALMWTDYFFDFPDENTGFLLMEYPGYGHSEGSPTRRTIAEASEAAHTALAEHLDRDPERLAPFLGYLGVSLGAAVALEHAIVRPPDRLVLIAPFTRLVDMARGTVGWPLCHLVLDKFDNRARLAEIAAWEERPEVILFHGDADRIVPVRMGRSLAEAHPDWIVYREVPDADHNDILGSSKPAITGAMLPSAERIFP